MRVTKSFLKQKFSLRFARTYFQAAMDVDGEAKLLDFVNKELGGWPVLDDSNWDDNKYDPMDTLITSRLYAYRQVVDLVVSNNPKLPQQSALRVCRFSQRIQDR
jgi:hypothetical protein